MAEFADSGGRVPGYISNRETTLREHAQDGLANALGALSFSPRGAHAMSRRIANPIFDHAPLASDAAAFNEAQTPVDYGLATIGVVPGSGDFLAGILGAAWKHRRKAWDVVKKGDRYFVTGSNGTPDMGFIRRGITRMDGNPLPSKPIRMEPGEIGPEGYGAFHLAEERHKRAKDLGYQDAYEMFEDVARNYDVVIEQPNGALMLVKKNGANRYGVVRLQEHEDGYYGMTTTFPEEPKRVGKEHRTSLSRMLNKQGGTMLWEKK